MMEVGREEDYPVRLPGQEYCGFYNLAAERDFLYSNQEAIKENFYSFIC